MEPIFCLTHWQICNSWMFWHLSCLLIFQVKTTLTVTFSALNCKMINMSFPTSNHLKPTLVFLIKDICYISIFKMLSKSYNMYMIIDHWVLWHWNLVRSGAAPRILNRSKMKLQGWFLLHCATLNYIKPITMPTKRPLNRGSADQ